MGFPFIEQMEQMIYYLNLKRKKVYIRNIIRELSKDVFHLFYLFQPIDITGIFTRTDA